MEESFQRLHCCKLDMILYPCWSSTQSLTDSPDVVGWYASPEAALPVSAARTARGELCTEGPNPSSARAPIKYSIEDVSTLHLLGILSLAVGSSLRRAQSKGTASMT